MRSKNTITNIYKMQAYDLIMRGYFCIGFIDFMLKGKLQNNSVMFSITKSLRWKKMLFVAAIKNFSVLE